MIVRHLGWDGTVVLGVAGVVLCAVAAKGVGGLEPWIAIVLLADAAYLGFAWWRRT